MHGPAVGRMAAARKAQTLANRLADYRRAGVEQPRNYGRIDLGHVAVEHFGAVGHRQPRDAYVVLDRDRLAGQRTTGIALYFAAPVPCAERILSLRRRTAGIARILD